MSPSNRVFFQTEILSYFADEPIQFDLIDEYKEFDERKMAGVNDNRIAELIRKDLIEEFVEYSNEINIPLNCKIPESLYETNIFLLENKPTLIEYAAFYGSVKTFIYLQTQGVELSPSLWLYAILSNNAEIINLLEENKIEPKDGTYFECFTEAIKCHHNDIANYLFYNKDIKQFFCDICINYQDYDFIPSNPDFYTSDFLSIKQIFMLIHEYPDFVNFLFEESYIDINMEVIYINI